MQIKKPELVDFVSPFSGVLCKCNGVVLARKYLSEKVKEVEFEGLTPRSLSVVYVWIVKYKNLKFVDKQKPSQMPSKD